MTTLLYDAGALVAADRGDRRLLALHQRALLRGLRPAVPTPVLAQGWRGGPQPQLARVLAGCRLEPLTPADARAAGALCARAGTSDIVDAAVVVLARTSEAAVVTTDRGDLVTLAAAVGERLDVIDI